MSDSNTAFIFKRIEELAISAGKHGRFTGFMNEADRILAEEYSKKRRLNYMPYGGYSSSERKVMGLFMAGAEPSVSDFPIRHIKASFFGDVKPAHKDFLGTLISGGIKREAIGDICVGEKSADIFVLDSVAEYICENIEYVKGCAVKFSLYDGAFEPPEKEFENISVTVQSPRIDAVVSHISRVSREKAVLLINQGRVILNYKEISDKTVQIKDGDILTIRSVGKFIIDSATDRTQKGRIKITARKYK